MQQNLIEKQQELVAACNRLRDQEWITLDTEFMRVSTYYPRLCLIQVATPDDLVCIDPLLLDNLDPLLEVLVDSRILKILHAVRQDVEVLFHHTDIIPQPIFDTQIAAAFLGYGDQRGYAWLVESLLNVNLPKAQTRTDWCARPLSLEQLEYAADDVHYLRSLYQILLEKLKALGRLQWVEQECEALLDTDLYHTVPNQAYSRLKRGQTLCPEAQQRLRALATWREQTAQKHDRPREWIVRSAVLYEIATNNPTDLETLSNIKGMTTAMRRRWGQSLLDVLQSCPTDSSTVIWQARKTMSSDQASLAKRLMGLIRQCAERHNLTASLLGTKGDVEKLILGDQASPLVTGWRRELVGDEMLGLLKQAST